jgi:hypothetical protein
MARNQGHDMQSDKKTGSLETSGKWSGKNTLKLRDEVGKCQVTPQAIWSIAKYFSERGGPKALSAIHGSLCPIFYLIDVAKITADCFENQFRVHGLCDCDHRRHVEVNWKPCWQSSMMTPLLVQIL